MEGFDKEAVIRNAFASTSGSVKLSQIDSCSPDSFEEWTALLLERDGCKILRRRGGSNDQGADVIAVTPGGLRVVLQCKFSTKLRHTVDPRYFHELNGTARQEHGADIVGLVTNRTASTAAQDFATKHRIHFINRRVLQRWATYGVSWLPSGGQAIVAAPDGVARDRASLDNQQPLHH
ncbi:restriction endonuclease [Micromonospora chalcea]|uniref:restriction endonuclease n=1 Tax=Micromonospora chalcea TaxID=1874 RepID=UPI00380897EE